MIAEPPLDRLPDLLQIASDDLFSEVDPDHCAEPVLVRDGTE